MDDTQERQAQAEPLWTDEDIDRQFALCESAFNDHMLLRRIRADYEAQAQALRAELQEALEALIESGNTLGHKTGGYQKRLSELRGTND